MRGSLRAWLAHAISPTSQSIRNGHAAFFPNGSSPQALASSHLDRQRKAMTRVISVEVWIR
jgi:hypothetical protein